VGKALAFDAWKGRLWAVCPRCTRWNLAPIEERWEAVDSAEKQFTDARLRVQSENIGLAKLRDGTRLIRVGEALPGELAAWRYGDQLVRRRNQYLLWGGAAVAAGAGLAFGGVWMTALSAGGAFQLFNLGQIVWNRRQSRRIVHRIPATEAPSGRELVIRCSHVIEAYLTPPEAGLDLQLHVPGADVMEQHVSWWRRPIPSKQSIVLTGGKARTVLNRAMVHVNTAGAARRDVDSALALLLEAGSPDDFVRNVARRKRFLRHPDWLSGSEIAKYHLAKPEALALEMALHEESERQALEGELAALEAAWREAEEIAHIADYLPDDPPEA
jgi:hypothetical protein